MLELKVLSKWLALNKQDPYLLNRAERIMRNFLVLGILTKTRW